MRTSNRFATAAALLAAPLLAVAAPTGAPGSDASREAQEQNMDCKQSCDCHAKAQPKSPASQHRPDFFRANDYSPVP